MLAVAGCASSTQKQISPHIQPMTSSGNYKSSTSSDNFINDELVQMLLSQGLDPEEVSTRLRAAGISIATLQNQVKTELEYQRSAK